MSDDNKNDKPSIFKKVSQLANSTLDGYILKAKNQIIMNDVKKEEEEVFHSKFLNTDPHHVSHSQGYKEKTRILSNEYLRQMSMKNDIVASIIITRQNQVSKFSRKANSDHSEGWKLKIKNREEELDAIKMELIEEDPELKGLELKRKAKKLLHEKFKDSRVKAESYIENCGLLENRSFETKKWKFDSVLRAWVRDSLVYDFYASEVVPSNDGTPHHFYPVDASTIRFATPHLNQHSNLHATNYYMDILHPEKEQEEIQEQGVLDLDSELLELNAYKFVQVFRGVIERAFTNDELKVGIRNRTTDIHYNGYGISELELAMNLITNHLNAENYNQAYFTQGFSSKGILHIKANIPRRKLETVKQQWHHMLRGSRNSFRTNQTNMCSLSNRSK